MYNNTQDNLSLHKQTNQDIGKHTHQNVGAKWTWKHIHCPSRWRRVGNRLLALLVLFWLHQPPLGLTAAAAGRFSCPFADLRDLAVLPRLPPLFCKVGVIWQGILLRIFCQLQLTVFKRKASGVRLMQYFQDMFFLYIRVG
jgi:hypothetical protein